jgi:glycosyltransferase involved in cell wall biosynthesis
MLVTVITCVKNGEDFLEQCLNSVETQTYKNVEHIIVDGFSTDKSIEIIQNYMKRNEGKSIKLVQAPPKGISNAMNIGIDNATGDIVHFLHHDDYYISSNSIERAAKIFKNNPNHEWVIGNIVVEINGEIREFKKNINKKNLERMMSMFNWIPHENTFVKREIFKKYGCFREDLKQTMDYEFWLRFMDKTEPVMVDESFTVFIIHPHSTSSNPSNWTKIAREMLHTWKDYKIIPFVGRANKIVNNTLVEKISSLIK